MRRGYDRVEGGICSYDEIKGVTMSVSLDRSTHPSSRNQNRTGRDLLKMEFSSNSRRVIYNNSFPCNCQKLIIYIEDIYNFR